MWEYRTVSHEFKTNLPGKLSTTECMCSHRGLLRKRGEVGIVEHRQQTHCLLDYGGTAVLSACERVCYFSLTGSVRSLYANTTLCYLFASCGDVEPFFADRCWVYLC